MKAVLSCAACGAPTPVERVVETRHRETYGRGWREEWLVKSACAECLSVTETAAASDTPEVTATLVFPGTEATRLRDALRRANESGALRREVGKLLTDPARCVLAGVPEVFPDVLPGIGRHLRLRTNLEVKRGDASRPELTGPYVPETEPWGGPISRKRQATAVKGDGPASASSNPRSGSGGRDGERGPASASSNPRSGSGGRDGERGPGGVIPARSVGTEEPLKNIYGALLLVGLRVTVVGARASALLVEVPEWAVAPIGGHSRILVPWGTATRDED